MNARSTLFCCAVALAAAAPAAQAQPRDASLPHPHPIEGYYPEPDAPTTMTRAEVAADVRAARAAGQLGFHHDGDMPAYPDAGAAQPPVRFASDRERAN
jgi:hypothetical protein